MDIIAWEVPRLHEEGDTIKIETTTKVYVGVVLANVYGMIENPSELYPRGITSEWVRIINTTLKNNFITDYCQIYTKKTKVLLTEKDTSVVHENYISSGIDNEFYFNIM